MIYSGNNYSGTTIVIPRMPKCAELANAYIPYQTEYEIFSPLESLKKGTVFSGLCSGYIIKKK